MDDKKFDSITELQWQLYAELVLNDKKNEMDNNIAYLEYLASFWNPEGVKKAQEVRNSRKEHRFMSEDELEEFMVSGEFKNNAYIDLIKKISEQNKPKPEMPKNGMKRMPTDLSSLKNIIGDDFGRRQ